MEENETQEAQSLPTLSDGHNENCEWQFYVKGYCDHV